MTLFRRLYRAYLDAAVPHRFATRRFLRRGGAVPPRPSCLDIGAGTAPYRKCLEKSMDISHYVEMDIAPGGTTAVAGDSQCLPFLDGSFGMVVSFNVLQHVPDSGATMREITRVLVPGGLVVFTYPFLYGECDVQDFRRWTRSGMEHDLAAAGLAPIRHERLGGLLFTWTSMAISLVHSVTPGGRRSWRGRQTVFGVLRMAFIMVFTFPFVMLGWVALLLDRVLPWEEFYAGGMIIARKS